MSKQAIHVKLLIYGCAFELKALVVILFLLIASYIGHAQKQSEDSLFLPNLQIGISAGPSTFFGDIKQYQFFPSYEEWRFAYGLNFNYHISPVFNIGFQGLYGKLTGSKKEQNICFENDYYELNFNTTINLNNLFGKNREDRLVNIYGVVGFGIMNFNSIVKRLDEYYVLKRVGYGYGTGFEGRQRQEFFMFGAGIDFRISKRVNLLLETVNKYPNSDVLDGVESGKYNDVYNYTSIGISYRFAFLKKTKRTEVFEQVYHPVALQNILSQDIEYQLKSEPDYSLVYPTQQTEISMPEKEKTVTSSTIEFRVQILAEYAKPYSKSWISENYNIPLSEIKENIVNGYYIYTVGSFPTYKMASEKSVELQTYNGIYDAFVVAFKDGKRVFPER